MKKLLITFIFCTIVGSLLYAGTKDPVAVLFQVRGNVEYTKNGIKWKKVRRNKFLFAGYQIRSSATGSGIITNRISGKDSLLRPNTTLLVTNLPIAALESWGLDPKHLREMFPHLIIAARLILCVNHLLL